MKIGIDARLINETGVGRYIRNLIRHLAALDKKNQYVVYLSEAAYKSFTPVNGNWQKRVATPRWHTLWEQIAMPILFLRDRLDLLHVPYFTIPVFYPKRYIVTIHDLIILHFATGKATTLPRVLYEIRKIGFRLILYFGLRRAVGVIVPSQTTKREIIDHFHLSADSIHVTREGVDGYISNDTLHKTHDKLIEKPYFLYVGNAYPHKNLDMLISAFGDFIGNPKNSAFHLVLVGKDDFFYRRLKKNVAGKNMQASVIFFGEADDSSLRTLYTHARGLVFPSLMEGFGLPALEALSLGIPVMCSDIPIFHEILKDIPFYINPDDRTSIVQGLTGMCTGGKARMTYKDKEIQALLAEYSWKQLAMDTMNLYNTLGKPSSGI